MNIENRENLDHWREPRQRTGASHNRTRLKAAVRRREWRIVPVCFSSVAWLSPGGGKGKKAMTIQVTHSGADELEVQRREICAQHASQARQ
jgi:hypothetical protein